MTHRTHSCVRLITTRCTWFLGQRVQRVARPLLSLAQSALDITPVHGSFCSVACDCDRTMGSQYVGLVVKYAHLKAYLSQIGNCKSTLTTITIETAIGNEHVKMVANHFTIQS